MTLPDISIRTDQHVVDIPRAGLHSSRKPAIVVGVAIVLFILFFGLSNWFRQVNLVTSQFDMGNMDQVLWNSLHGRWFQMTSPGQAVNELRTAYHADYLLLAYLPFYALFPDPRTPLVLQIIAVASSAIPLFWLARKKLGPHVGAFIAVLFLLFPTVQYAITFDVHAVVLAIPILLWAWWAATERKWWAYYPLVATALLAKEEVGLVVSAMGLYWIWRRRYRMMGASNIVLGIGWSLLMILWAIPQARHMPGHFALDYYAELGGSYPEILRNFFLHPLTVLRVAFNGQGLSLLRALFIPVAFLPILGLPVLLVAVPEFAINMLSSNPNLKTIFFQYMSVITPIMFLALIDGWARGRTWINRLKARYPKRSWGRFISTAVLGLMAAGVWFWSPLPGMKHTADAVKVFHTSPYRQDVLRVQQSLQLQDRVVTTNNLGPQFSRRQFVWGFPDDLEHADALVVLQGGDYDLAPKDVVDNTVQQLTTDPQWKLIFHDRLFWYFRRLPTS